MVSKESIQQELEQILASDLFGGKRQACKFLQYIVTETLEGRGEKITQYGIAIEALGKPVDYCPTESPAVRVEAGRVRKLLEEYYVTEGQGHGCQILLPVGGYMPVFRKADTAHVQWRRLEGKRVQSVGPKVYIACQNPAAIRDDGLRHLIYKLRSSMPVMLGKLGTVQIALADPGYTFSYVDHALEHAWRHYQAEFLLYSEASLQGESPKLRYVLIHTLSREVVWTGEFMVVPSRSDEVLEAMYMRLVNEVFSLHEGVALSFWSHYWYRQSSIPEAYQVLVTHVRFVQDRVSDESFYEFWRACQKRTRQYHDDALAHLHYAIACLYALMLRADVSEPLDGLWQRQSLAALALNPGSPLAHAIFALHCHSQGEVELSRVEIDIALKSNPFDAGCGRLVAVGLCALRAWERSFNLLKEVSALESPFPDPLRSVPCLYYFRRGHYADTAQTEAGFQDLGGWGNFGTLVTHCRAGDCHGCVHAISHAVDRVMLPPETGLVSNPYFPQEPDRMLRDASTDAQGVIPSTTPSG